MRPITGAISTPKCGHELPSSSNEHRLISYGHSPPQRWAQTSLVEHNVDLLVQYMYSLLSAFCALFERACTGKDRSSHLLVHSGIDVPKKYLTKTDGEWTPEIVCCFSDSLFSCRIEAQLSTPYCLITITSTDLS